LRDHPSQVPKGGLSKEVPSAKVQYTLHGGRTLGRLFMKKEKRSSGLKNRTLSDIRTNGAGRRCREDTQVT
jgi:hypothetical protein